MPVRAHEEQLVVDGALHSESCVTEVPGLLRGIDAHQMGPEDTHLKGRKIHFSCLSLVTSPLFKTGEELLVGRKQETL